MARGFFACEVLFGKLKNFNSRSFAVLFCSKGLQNYSEAIPFDHSLQHLKKIILNIGMYSIKQFL